jgi:glutamine amidotransferase
LANPIRDLSFEGMCRLVAYAGSPLPLDRLLFEGDHSLYRQSFEPLELLSGSVNVDGYGLAWFPSAGEAVRVAEARPLWHDQDLRPLLASLRYPVAIGAVRSATPGISTDRSAVSPFLRDGWAFTLNGFLRPFPGAARRLLHGRIHPERLDDLRSLSDTEALFLLFLSEMDRGTDPSSALVSAAEQALEVAGESGVAAQLNLLASDGSRVLATRWSSAEPSNSLYLARESELAPEGTLLASEPLDRSEGERWEPIPHGSLVEMDAAGAREIRSL